MPDHPDTRLDQLPPAIPLKQAAAMLGMSCKTYVRHHLPFTELSPKKRVVVVADLVAALKGRAA